MPGHDFIFLEYDFGSLKGAVQRGNEDNVNGLNGENFVFLFLFPDGIAFRGQFEVFSLFDAFFGKAAINEFLVELEGGFGEFGVEMFALELFGVRVEDGLSVSDEEEFLKAFVAEPAIGPVRAPALSEVSALGSGEAFHEV